MSVNSKMTAIADAIRAKTGGTGLLTLDDMAQDIAAIDTSENLDDVLDEQETLIADIKSTLAEKGVKPEQTKTATPSLSQQTIVPDSGYTLGGVTVEPITSTLLTSLDPDFKPENIAKDANLFGLVGTHAASAGMQVATGTVAAPLKYDEDNDTLSYAFSVSGLSFSPRVVALFANADWLEGDYVPGNIDNSDPYVDFATLVDFNTNIGTRVIMSFTNVDEFYNLWSRAYTNRGELAKTANGFVAEDVNVDEQDYGYPVFNATYIWYAFG